MAPLDFPQFTNPALEAFAPLARGFCELIETRRSRNASAMLAEAHRHVVGLYAAAVNLPDTSVLYDQSRDDDDTPFAEPAIDPDRMTHEEWNALFRDLCEIAGEFNSYREIFDPYDWDDKAEVVGSLADDLADIYREIRAGLLKWNRGEPGAALWEWRFTFEIHWCEHASGALRAFSALASREKLPWPGGEAGAA